MLGFSALNFTALNHTVVERLFEGELTTTFDSFTNMMAGTVTGAVTLWTVQADNAATWNDQADSATVWNVQ